VMLDALQLLKRALGRVARIGGLEATAHHPVQDRKRSTNPILPGFARP
jgi:hypothetical protein